MYMKGVIVTLSLSFLFVFSFASAQIEDGKFGLAKIQPQLDFTFGNTNEIDFLLGANAKQSVLLCVYTHQAQEYSCQSCVL